MLKNKKTMAVSPKESQAPIEVKIAEIINWWECERYRVFRECQRGRNLIFDGDENRKIESIDTLVTKRANMIETNSVRLQKEIKEVVDERATRLASELIKSIKKNIEKSFYEIEIGEDLPSTSSEKEISELIKSGKPEGLAATAKDIRAIANRLPYIEFGAPFRPTGIILINKRRIIERFEVYIASQVLHHHCDQENKSIWKQLATVIDEVRQKRIGNLA